MALKLADRAQAEKPIRVGLIGAGKFGTMFLLQALRTLRLQVVGWRISTSTAFDARSR
jgi:predicted homoserine dehydrogenase-like protein